RWFDSMLERQGKRDYHFVICLLEDGRAIGTIGLHEVDQESGSAAFGIAIGEKAEWDKGYGTDALNAIADFGFGELRLERIWLDVYVQNLRAQRSSFAVEALPVEGSHCRHCDEAPPEDDDRIRRVTLRTDAFHRIDPAKDQAAQMAMSEVEASSGSWEILVAPREHHERLADARP